MQNISFKLPDFEGPLDLLLHLIQKNKVDIYDIPIAKITSQYLEYLAAWEEMDLDITSDFLVMAAHLINIKSRMLLPMQEEEEEDPVQELAERLTEYKKIKEAAGILKESQFSSINNFFKVAEKLSVIPPENPTMPTTFLFDAFANVLERAVTKLPPPRGAFSSITETKRVSVSSRIRYVSGILKKNKKVVFEKLFEGIFEKGQLVATFLAVLHLVEKGRVNIQSKGEKIYLSGA